MRQCLVALDRLLLGRPNDPGWAQSCRLWLGGVRGPRADQGEVRAYGVQEQGRGFGEAEVPGVGELDQLGVGDGVGDRAASGGRADPVVAADDDERRGGDLGESVRTS